MKEKRFPARRSLGVFSLVLVLSLVLAVCSFAEPPEKKTVPGAEEKMEIPVETSVTWHKIDIGGDVFRYEASAGFLPLFDDEGRIKAKMFHVAYVRDGERNSVCRPITFVFNGGPGSSALMLHVGAIGPRTLQLDGRGLKEPVPPYELKDNPYSLLDVSDLVFIDPVGTGFSRAAKKEEGKDFWGVAQDIESIGEFIRIYLTREGRWRSPLFLAGESYGGLRAAGLAPALQDAGINPSGIILISPAPSYGELMSSPTNDRPFIHVLPSLAAAAWYHHRLNSEMQSMKVDDLMEEVRQWAEDDYAGALWRGNALSEDERRTVMDRLAAYTAMPKSDILGLNLRVPAYAFAGQLMRNERKFISIYDARLTAAGGWYRFKEDPAMTFTDVPYMTVFSDYLRRDLDFPIDRKYLSINGDLFHEWDFESGVRGPVGYPSTVEDLAGALRRSEFMKVFVAMGRYDLVCPRDATIYSLRHMDIPSSRLKNVILETYAGGHMMYTNPEAHRRLKEDLAAFYGSVSNGRKMAVDEGN